MPVNTKEKFVFIHIPKCAGTSVARYLNIDDSYYSLEHEKINNVLYTPQHYTYKILNKKINLKDYFTFSFVRNPYNRVISDFFWLQDIGKLDKTTDKKNFDEWFFKYYSVIDIDHKLPQNNYICDIDGNILVDYVGRVESFNEDFNTILNFIKQPKPNSPLKKNNHSKTDEFKCMFLTSDVIDKINEIYNKDFKLFGYDLL